MRVKAVGAGRFWRGRWAGIREYLIDHVQGGGAEGAVLVAHGGFCADQPVGKLRQPVFGRLPIEVLVGCAPEVVKGIPHTQLRGADDKLKVFFEFRGGYPGRSILLVKGIGVVVDAGGTLYEGRDLAGQVALVYQGSHRLAGDSGVLARLGCDLFIDEKKVGAGVSGQPRKKYPQAVIQRQIKVGQGIAQHEQFALCVFEVSECTGHGVVPVY